MDVGLEDLLLTRVASSFTWVDVPYSGDDEFGLARDEPGCGDRLALRIDPERDRSPSLAEAHEWSARARTWLDGEGAGVASIMAGRWGPGPI